jgi:hypothetical protein
MRHYKFQAAQAAANLGFTDLFIIKNTDLTETTDNTDQTLTLDALEFGDLVGYEVLLQIKTAFDPAPSADCGVTAAIGVTGATTQFLAASAFFAAGAATAAKTSYATAAGGAPYVVPTGGKNLLATIDITDADGALDEFTAAGELWLWMKIMRWNESSGLFQA